MRGIFISYRESDTKPWALLLRDQLVNAFGEEQVFLDKDRLHAGNWREQIQRALDQCAVVLLVIGQRWLTVTDARGIRRLDNVDDVHRQEIAAALARKDVTVIPVCVDGAEMPPSEDLPADLRALTDQQAKVLGDRSVQRTIDVQSLVADIERVTGLVAKRGSPRKLTLALPWLAVRRVLLSLAISLVLLVIADVALGWSLDGQEKSFVVIVVLIGTVWVTWSRNRRNRGTDDTR
jgi:TIR domain-containing protein